MKLARCFFAFSLFLFSLFSLPQSVHAVEPFPPFSKEGNPDEDYLIEQFFPLFRYIKPARLKVYENKVRSRRYEALEICPNGDHRDQVCSVDPKTGRLIDECTGGEVDLCYKGDRSGQMARPAYSKNGSCRYNKNDPYVNEQGEVPGKCDYTQSPKNGGELKATDFSEIMRSVPTGASPSPGTGTEGSQTPADQTVAGLIYAKLQNEQLRYSGTGTDNPLTWGSQRLQLTAGEQAVKQLMVVIRAKQTKDTVSKTGEWPLGWVDWGYQTANGKTLLEIRDELPGDVAGDGQAIVEASDDFFLNAGNLAAVSNVGNKIADATNKILSAAAKNPPPEWAADLLQAPVYPPSFRQGYAHASTCIWDNCCPGPRCGEFADFLEGNANGLYADTSVSQTFNAALDDLLLNYPLKEGVKIFRDLAAGNQLIRFAGSAAPGAIPSKIHARLTSEISDPCFKYVPKPADFTLGKFGFIMDYADPPTFLDPEKKCPGWAIQPELTKEQGGAIPQSLLAKLINLFFSGRKIDDVEPTKQHLITIPDAMGQYISEIEDPVFQTRDTLSENEQQNEYNKTLSNIIDATEDMYYAGKGQPVADAKRRLGLLTCGDPDYSAPQLTSIEAYALGTRIGCFDSAAVAGGKCTGDQFNKIIGDTNELPLPQAVSTIMSSKMFVNGQLNPDLAEAYAQVEKETGVPCEVLAAHHYEEATTSFYGSNNPAEYSAANGGRVGKKGFLESVRNAAKGVLRHPPTDRQSLITEMSDFNGGGNSNCNIIPGVTVPWGGCPRQFIGEDDPYATNLLDPRHTGMYLLYCGDFQVCNPVKPYDRPGAFPAALVVHNVIKGASSSSSSARPSAAPATTTGQGTQKVNPAGKCGEGFIDTGLGCLPYQRDALISTLLSFIAGLSGLISLVTMFVAVFQIMTAAGDAKKLQKGKELFAAAVAGLLFVIFSVTLLRIIAGDIIKLPGF